MPAKSVKNIAWLAGLLEGEGSFSCLDNGTNPIIKIGMVDKDVILKASNILDYNGKIVETVLKSDKIFYIIQLYGNHAIQWMMTIYSLMGNRRKERIGSILFLWKNYERQQKQFCINGHKFTEENSYFTPDGIRACRECRKIRSEEHDRKRREDPNYKEKRKAETKKYWENKNKKAFEDAFGSLENAENILKKGTVQ